MKVLGPKITSKSETQLVLKKRDIHVVQLIGPCNIIMQLTFLVCLKIANAKNFN